MPSTDFQTWFDPQFDDYVAHLETLVNLDSGSYQRQGVAKVLNWIADFLAADGIEVHRHHTKDLLTCVSSTVNPGQARDQAVLMLGHCDTVFPAGEATRRPFRVEGTTAHGPGVADMKAGVLMNAYLLRAWHRLGRRDLQVSALFTCDEEIGSLASSPVIEALCREHRYVFNAEPGRPNGNVVIGRKGGVFFEVDVRGKAAHAGGNFYDGISAISALGKKIGALEQLIDRDEGITLNVGLIEGGQSVNTVAPHAKAGVDLRIRTLEQREKCLTEIARICTTSVIGESTTWAIRGEFKPFVQSAGSKALAERYLATSLAHGVMVQGEITGGCSDSGIAAACGCDVVCAVGPAGGGFHTPNEYVRLETVVPKATVLFNTMMGLP